ncbi:MAG: hypothetical protein M3112_05990 [Actinomycetia bacterium]|nr:hypothetical protein [Actinomycetes bacterium]
MFRWLAGSSKLKERIVLKQSLVIAGGLVLTVSLSLVALAFAIERTPTPAGPHGQGGRGKAGYL